MSGTVVTLDKMGTGETGTIRSVADGKNVAEKLESIGLRSGKKITKISSQLMSGPVTVSVDGRHVGMGRGMAAKIEIEVSAGQ